MITIKIARDEGFYILPAPSILVHVGKIHSNNLEIKEYVAGITFSCKEDEWYSRGTNDFDDWFSKLTKEEQLDVIHNIDIISNPQKWLNDENVWIRLND